ncbi:MAG: hypothetical protein E7554_02000 [Ruminococcaceae bacterium]|nr:hypothetical protein [Oscillospiraceae bacterium]
MKALRYLHPAVIIAVLALEAAPWGAVCNFAIAPEDGGGVDRQTFSYFDMLPLGYANAGPFLTAVLSCALLIAAVVACFTQSKGALGTVMWLSVAAVVTSLMPLMFGLSYYSLVGLCITLLLMASAVLGAVRKGRIG